MALCSPSRASSGALRQAAAGEHRRHDPMRLPWEDSFEAICREQRADMERLMSHHQLRWRSWAEHFEREHIVQLRSDIDERHRMKTQMYESEEERQSSQDMPNIAQAWNLPEATKGDSGGTGEASPSHSPVYMSSELPPAAVAAQYVPPPQRELAPQEALERPPSHGEITTSRDDSQRDVKMPRTKMLGSSRGDRHDQDGGDSPAGLPNCSSMARSTKVNIEGACRAKRTDISEIGKADVSREELEEMGFSENVKGVGLTHASHHAQNGHAHGQSAPLKGGLAPSTLQYQKGQPSAPRVDQVEQPNDSHLHYLDLPGQNSATRSSRPQPEGREAGNEAAMRSKQASNDSLPLQQVEDDDIRSQFSTASDQRVKDGKTTASMLSSMGLRSSAEKEDKQRKPLFADAEAVKEMVRSAIHKVEYNVHDLYHDDGWCAYISRSPTCESITLSVITVNAVWMGIDTDMNKAALLRDAHPIFQFMEHFMTGFFTIELIIRFIAFKRKRSAFTDNWFAFDFSLVVMMVVETWIITLIIEFTTGMQDGKMRNASILRLLRLMRIARMARLMRLIRSMPELMILIKGMSMAARTVLLTVFLLLIVCYIFAICMTTLTEGTPVYEVYWYSVFVSMKTLVLHGCFLEDLPDVVNATADENPLYGMVIMVFVFLASMTIMNMLVGVLCEVVSCVASIEKETLHVEYVKNKISDSLKLIDVDGSGGISREEFEQLLAQPVAARALQDVGVDVVGLVDFADFLFSDKDHIEFGDLMETVLQLRGSNNATVKDLVDLRKSMIMELCQLQESVLEAMGHKDPSAADGEGGKHEGHLKRKMTQFKAMMSEQEAARKQSKEAARKAFIEAQKKLSPDEQLTAVSKRAIANRKSRSVFAE